MLGWLWLPSAIPLAPPESTFISSLLVCFNQISNLERRALELGHLNQCLCLVGASRITNVFTVFYTIAVRFSKMRMQLCLVEPIVIMVCDVFFEFQIFKCKLFSFKIYKIKININIKF